MSSFRWELLSVERYAALCICGESVPPLTIFRLAQTGRLGDATLSSPERVGPRGRISHAPREKCAQSADPAAARSGLARGFRERVFPRARARARPRARNAEREDWATGIFLRAVGRQGIHLAGYTAQTREQEEDDREAGHVLIPSSNIIWNYETFCTRCGRNRARGRAGARARTDNPFRNRH